MRRFRLRLVAVMVVAVLFAGQYAMAESKEAKKQDTPAAITLVQDKNEPLLARHKFNGDTEIFINIDPDIDSGFYVSVSR